MLIAAKLTKPDASSSHRVVLASGWSIDKRVPSVGPAASCAEGLMLADQWLCLAGLS